MSISLAERVAIVTGGASGIGRAIATRFAEHGADVVIADRRETPREGGPPTAEAIAESTDARAEFIETDVSDVDDVRDAVAAAGALGGLDIMVNNAAIAGESTFEAVTEADYERLMAVNARGVFFGTQVAAEAMDGGSIINLSSIAGLRGSSNLVLYSMSKGAVRLFTYAAAAALGPSIRVNAIHPGAIETTMSTEDEPLITPETRGEYREAIPLGRIGTPADIADAALYLASDLSSYVTAQSIVVDGGLVNTG